MLLLLPTPLLVCFPEGNQIISALVLHHYTVGQRLESENISFPTPTCPS